MASLVADYSDSESEDECSPDTQDPSFCSDKIKEEPKGEWDDVKNVATDIKQEAVDIKQEVVDIKQEAPHIKQEAPDIKHEANLKSAESSNFFIASENASEDWDDEEDEKSSGITKIKVKTEESSGQCTKLPNPMGTQKLPSINDASSFLTNSSVFVNQFERAEQAKNKILERHVRLTEAAPKKPAHQPLCWKFKKGKCHLGKNCRFFHDRDALSSVDESAALEPSSSTSTGKSNNGKDTSAERQRSSYHPAAFQDARRRPLEPEPVDDDNYMASMKKKKRVGINDALVPPKKAYDSLLQLRQKERPWTMPNATR